MSSYNDLDALKANYQAIHDAGTSWADLAGDLGQQLPADSALMRWLAAQAREEAAAPKAAAPRSRKAAGPATTAAGDTDE